MALIELDLGPAGEPARRTPPPVRAYRLPALLIVLALLTTLGAAAAPDQAVLWRALGAVPIGADGAYTLAGDQVFTTSGSGAGRDVVAYRIGKPVKRLWSVSLPDPMRGGRPGGIVAYRSGGEVVIGGGGYEGWVVADAGTGRVLWRPAAGFTMLSGGLGYTLQTRFRAGTQYVSGVFNQSEQIFYGEDGTQHSEAPLTTEVRGVSVAGGRPLWTYVVTGSIDVFPVPGDDEGVLVLSAGALTRLDGRTGKVKVKVSVDGPTYGTMIGGVLVVDYLTAAGTGNEIGYDASGLAVRWRRSLASVNAEDTACQAVLCEPGRRVVVDLATGRPLWMYSATEALKPAGPFLLVYAVRTGRPLRLTDPATGEVRADVSGWATGLVPSAASDPVVVFDRDLRDGGTAFAAVTGTSRQLLQLGTSPDPVGSCTAATNVLACTTFGQLRLWSFRV